jgi:hypothetical protein
MMFLFWVWVKRVGSIVVVVGAPREAVPVVNRRDPRATRSAPQPTQRRAREVPVDPPGRAEGMRGGSFLVCFDGGGFGDARVLLIVLIGLDDLALLASG